MLEYSFYAWFSMSLPAECH